MLTLTDEQRTIIDAPVADMLVSAAAGSGKTAVLTERICSRVAAGTLDLQRLLLVTFTEAAAGDMRLKLERAIRDRLARATDPTERSRLSRQMALLPHAAVSTIHSFCLSIIREFAHTLRDSRGKLILDANLRVEGGSFCDDLRDEALDDLLKEQYEAADRQPDERSEAFLRLSEGYGSFKNDDRLRDLLRSQLTVWRSLPDYHLLAQQSRDMLDQATSDFASSGAAEILISQLRFMLAQSADGRAEMADLLASGMRLQSKNAENASMMAEQRAGLDVLNTLERLLDDPATGWNAIVETADRLGEWKKPKNYSKRDERVGNYWQIFEQHIPGLLCLINGDASSKEQEKSDFPRPVFNRTAVQIETELRAMRQPMDVFIDLVLELDRRYANKKRALGLIDFADFEHLALDLLRRPEVADYYRQRFAEVYIDEYQDTSGVQEAILTLLSDRNLVVVGDIKQSIYRFRHARPELFLNRSNLLRQTVDSEGMPSSGLFRLTRNFRSVPGILAAVNEVFIRLMSPNAGEIDYSDGHWLYAHRGAEHPDPAVELWLVDRPRSDSLSDGDDALQTDAAAPRADAAALQTDAAAPRADAAAPRADAAAPWDDSRSDVSELTGEIQADAEGIPEENPEDLVKECRTVAAEIRRLQADGLPWNAVAVLCRVHNQVSICRDSLEQAGIPVDSGKISAAGNAPVLRVLEAWISLLDNADQDIPLAAVLRSDLHGDPFSLSDLAAIRLAAPTEPQRPERTAMPFYAALRHYCRSGPDQRLRARVAGFLDWLDDWRDRERTTRISELIGGVLNACGWIERLASRGPAGTAQIRQLQALRQMAERFEQHQPIGIYRFARYLERRRERAESTEDIVDAAVDAVRLLTIHGSKGLEFGVVFVIGCGRPFYTPDAKKRLIWHEQLGFGMDYVDPRRQVRFPTHLKLAMMAGIRAAAMAEEMRLLYVAMTRARDRLILTGSPNNNGRVMERILGLIAAADRDATPLPDTLVRGARSFLEWILMALADRKDLAGIKQALAGDCPTGDVRADACEKRGAWTVRWISDAQPIVPLVERNASDQAVKVDVEADDAADDAADVPEPPQPPPAAYPYDRASRLAFKTTVSELKRRDDAAARLADNDEIQPDEPPPPAGIPLELRVWQPEDHTRAPDARQIGTLLHHMLRFFDLPALAREDAAQAEEALTAHQQRMLELGMLQPDEMRAIDAYRPMLVRFLQSDLAAEIAAAQKEQRAFVFFEVPFTLALPAAVVYPPEDGLAPDDRIQIQGIIDCWYQLGESTVVVDYKSDRVGGDAGQVAATLIQRYQTQMGYYARAVSEATGRPVTRKVIWHIPGGRAIEVP